jgi:hypothetical protein
MSHSISSPEETLVDCAWHAPLPSLVEHLGCVAWLLARSRLLLACLDLACERLRSLTVAYVGHAEVRLRTQQRDRHPWPDLTVSLQVVMWDAVSPGSVPCLVKVHDVSRVQPRLLLAADAVFATATAQLAWRRLEHHATARADGVTGRADHRVEGARAVAPCAVPLRQRVDVVVLLVAGRAVQVHLRCAAARKPLAGRGRPCGA